MSKFFEDQRYENSVLYQRIEMLFTPAQNWKLCEWPMETDELIFKVREQFSMYFESDELIIKVMEELGYRFELNEHNRKMYWLINPA